MILMLWITRPCTLTMAQMLLLGTSWTQLGAAVRSELLFWHASVSFSAAQHWRAMADSGSQPNRGRQRVAIRIDIWNWYLLGTMHDRGLIDLSSEKAQHVVQEDL